MGELWEQVLSGDARAAARLMRDLDDRMEGSREQLRRLYPKTGQAAIIGITGNPGSGKSTVVDGLIAHYRAAGQRVGVVAVDPTSPFSGGAILGDRIRMQRHATDEGVFIRSLATRGHLGGLSRSTNDVVAVLDAMGFEIILVETVGVGQDEVEVVAAAQTAVVVTVPGLGDEIQALKAGILEVADVLVVNKCDREGADRAVRDLFGMLELRPPGTGDVEIVRMVAVKGEGIGELAAAIGRHQERARRSAAGSERDRRRAEAQLRALLAERFSEAIERQLAAGGGLAALVQAVAERQMDPYTAAEQAAAAVLRK